MYKLLLCLNYQVSPLLCSVFVPEANNHLAIRVENVNIPGDQYLVDVGFGAPCFEAISLDFESESPEFHQSFQTFKLVRDKDQYFRLHKTSKVDAVGSGLRTIRDGWGYAYYFKNKPISLAAAQQSIDENIYRNLSHHFNKILKLVGFSNAYCVCLKNGQTLLTEEEEGKLSVREMEVVTTDAIIKFFPDIPRDIVEKVVTNATSLPSRS